MNVFMHRNKALEDLNSQLKVTPQETRVAISPAESKDSGLARASPSETCSEPTSN